MWRPQWTVMWWTADDDVMAIANNDATTMTDGDTRDDKWWCDGRWTSHGNMTAMVLQNVHELYSNGGWQHNSHGATKCLWVLLRWRTATRQPQHCRMSLNSIAMADDNTTTMALWGDRVCNHVKRKHRELGKTWRPSHSSPKHTIPLSWLRA